MKRLLRMLGAGLGLLLFAGAGFAAGTEPPGIRGPGMQNPPQKRVMAHLKNLVDSANLLRQQVISTGNLEKGSAARTVAQMKQSLAQMQKHHAEYKKTMAEGVKNGMAETMQVMDARMAQAGKHLKMLEQELNVGAPDPKRLRLELDGLVRQCELMQMNGRKKKPGRP